MPTHKTPFSKRCEILSDFWGAYVNNRDEWSIWKTYVENDGIIAFPLAFGIHSGLVSPIDDSDIRDIIDEIYAVLCDNLRVSRTDEYSSLDDMFSRSAWISAP